jgi:hypothetical protein
LFAIGTGVVGWTPQQTLQTNMQHIVAAYNARTEFVFDIAKALFGDGKEPGMPTAAPAIRGLLRGHGGGKKKAKADGR